MSDREVPKPLREAWELALTHPDPLLALSAARALRAHLANWEAQLAAEAVTCGVTWETIGEALGVSRQAAWERFHERVPGGDRASEARVRYETDVRRLRDEVARLKRRARETRRLASDPSRHPRRAD